jgi:hypothetical protein
MSWTQQPKSPIYAGEYHQPLINRDGTKIVLLTSIGTYTSSNSGSTWTQTTSTTTSINLLKESNMNLIE